MRGAGDDVTLVDVACLRSSASHTCAVDIREDGVDGMLDDH